MLPMSYPISLPVYEDEAAASLLKPIIAMVPVALLVASAYLWSSGESAGSLALLGEAFIIGSILWVVFPRKYQVYEDYLRIVLGGPFAVKISFSQIKMVEVTGRSALTINFATRIAMTYVRIVMKQGLSIAITPKSNDLFVENANQALSRWQGTTTATGSTHFPG